MLPQGALTSSGATAKRRSVERSYHDPSAQPAAVERLCPRRLGARVRWLVARPGGPMVRRSCATAAHPEGAVRAGRCGPSDGAYVVECCVQACESITVALSHSAQGHGKQHYLSAHRPSGTGHTRKWRRLSLPSWLDRCHTPPRAGLHTCLRPLCAGPRHRSHDSYGQRQRREVQSSPSHAPTHDMPIAWQ